MAGEDPRVPRQRRSVDPGIGQAVQRLPALLLFLVFKFGAMFGLLAIVLQLPPPLWAPFLPLLCGGFWLWTRSWQRPGKHEAGARDRTD